MAAAEYTLRDGIDAVRQPLPPGQNSQLDQKAPVAIDRSFFVPATAFDLSSEHCPLDPITLQPYLVVPTPIEAKHPDADVITYHHVRFYREEKHLGGGVMTQPEKTSFGVISGLAVRVSMGQYQQRALHELGHFEQHPLGPWLPKNLGSKTATTIAGVAGIVPRELLDRTKPSGQRLVRHDQQTFEQIVDPSNVGIERFRNADGFDRSRRILASFFLRLATLEDVAALGTESQRDEYMHADNNEVRMRLGYTLLLAALEVAVEPYLPRVRDLRQKGYVQPGKKDPLLEIINVIQLKSVAHVLPLVDKKLKAAA